MAPRRLGAGARRVAASDEQWLAACVDPWDNPYASPELAVLRAFIDAHISVPDAALSISAFEAALLQQAVEGKFAPADRHALLLFWGRVSVAQARAAGRLSAAQQFARRHAISPELLAVFGSRDPLGTLLGRVDPDGSFTPGLARLTPRECEAVERMARGQGVVEIAQAMDRQGRHFSQGGLRYQSVQAYIDRGLAKLRVLFGLDNLATCL